MAYTRKPNNICKSNNHYRRRSDADRSFASDVNPFGLCSRSTCALHYKQQWNFTRATVRASHAIAILESTPSNRGDYHAVCSPTPSAHTVHTRPAVPTRLARDDDDHVFPERSR